MQPPSATARRFTPRNATTVAGASTLPQGPTVLLEDSQAFPAASQTPVGSQVIGLSAVPRTPRVRTILSAQAEEEALQLTNEGKITTKNAWNIKLLEGIHDSVSNALASTSEDVSQFTKCANLVEGGAKIWTQRVEHTCAWSNQIVRRLHRTDGKDEPLDGEGGNEGGDGNGGATQAQTRRNKKKERTVAECLSEINLDAKAKALTLLQSGTVSPQFRAITEKFEQGNAQGLLLNNAPLGSMGNLILDVDYSRSNVSEKDGDGRGSRPSSLLDLGHSSPHRPRLSTTVLMAEALSEALSPPTHHHAKHEELFDELDAVAAEEICLAPPSNRPSWGAASDSGPQPPPARGSRRLDVTARLTTTLAEDLLVPNTPIEAKVEVDLSPHRLSGDSQLRLSQGSPKQIFAAASQDDDIGGDDGGWGDDYNGDDGDDDEAEASGGLSDSFRGRSQAYGSRAGSSVRDLVSGAAELAMFDGMLSGGEQLAVAAEDPHTWFPMSQTTEGIGAFGRGFLQKLRKEKMLQSQAALDGSSQPGASSTQAPARKKSRNEGHVAFNSVDAMLADDAVVALSASDTKLMNRYRDNLKKVTEDFREKFLFKRSEEIARENGLLIPNVESKGCLPSWMPQKCNDIASLFQPGSTSALAWNVLNKRLSDVDDARVAALQQAKSARPSGVLPVSADNGVTALQDSDEFQARDMPLHVFDDDEMGGVDDYDDGLIDDDGADIAYAANFDLPRASGLSDDTADINEISTMGHFRSAVEAAAAEGNIEIMEKPDVVRMLQSNHASIPTQVDVVRLRRVMWHQTQRVLREVAPSLIRIPSADTPQQQQQQPSSFGNLKKSNQALKRSRDEDDERDDDGTAPSARADGGETVPFHRFSEVVAGVLPHIPSISTTGTLSPAFLFFSLLFLANEHGILLENVPGDVEDIYIAGIVNPTLTRPSQAALV